MVPEIHLTKAGEFTYVIPRTGKMRVPAIVFAGKQAIEELRGTKALIQARNVACLPGILKASYAMPDIHEGYGFPIGGVAAMDLREGVITPGGIGYDINCGVRVLTSTLTRQDVLPRLDRLVQTLFDKIPSGVGKEGPIRLTRPEADRVLALGAQWAVQKGYGTREDLAYCEEEGAMPGADPSAVSDKAFMRGKNEVGTLGSGNHFMEVGFVEAVYDLSSAEAYGLFEGQVVFWIHSGSRGLGHQVCTEYIALMRKAAQRYGLVQEDRQLDSAPFESPEGKRYFSAMAAAANYAWANRQVLTHYVREAVRQVFGEGISSRLPLLYDVAHNIGKMEEHRVDGTKMTVLVHRKGATRAFGWGNPAVPAKYRSVGQPVLIPGDMGRASYILAGTTDAEEKTFGSACHGAGRALSRTAAKKTVSLDELKADLESRGVIARSTTAKGLVEEAPAAYKDVDNVVEATQGAGLAKKVARLRPMGVIKG